MTSTQPTPAELTRAAELAPRVAEITGLEYHKSAWSDFGPPWGAFVSENPDPAKPELVFTHALDPRAFQQVLLALPDEDVGKLIWRKLVNNNPAFMKRSEPQWVQHSRLLTPAGMLAFYEALVAQDGGA